MAQCRRCGKRGLFLKLNGLGYCKECELAIGRTAAQQQDISNFYNNPILKKHYDTLQEIEQVYKLANSLEDPFNSQMDRCLRLCLYDISLAEQFRDLCIAYKQPLPNYGSFKRAAIIYDKRKMYPEAIEICTQSLRLGYTDRNDMHSRLARLLKKSGNKTLEQHLSEHGIKLK